MNVLSKQIEDTERKAQALLADLIPLVHDENVSADPEFIALLEKALNQAHSKFEKAKSESERYLKAVTIKPREAAHP
jgi:hypothetical protein